MAEITISATVVAASESEQGNRIASLELVYPRFIHSELMTHRMFSRNVSSSRAIPVAKVIDKVLTNPVTPIYWGKNQPGMQAETEIDSVDRARTLWKEAANSAAMYADELRKLGVHKQIANRVLEPFMWVTTLVTATEWNNFLALRTHKSAQPEFQELARKIEEALLGATYSCNYDWFSMVHAPYVDDLKGTEYETDCVNLFGDLVPKKLLVSVGRCCRVSYLTHRGTRDPDEDLALSIRLLTEGHMSPFEHVARPCDGKSANFVGWRSLRKCIPWESDFSVFLNGDYHIDSDLKKLGEKNAG